MIRVLNRNYPTPESFVEDFLATLTPGIIPRSNFIQWKAIEEKVIKLAPFIELYTDLRNRIFRGEDFIRETADSLLACDDPLPYIQCAFELLGHTVQELVPRSSIVLLS